MSSRTSAPAAAVTAAFLGPGTITTCSLAGAHYGVTLLWVLLLALPVLWIAQERCLRLGAVGGRSLSQALTGARQPALTRQLTRILVVAAIGIGCAAYQAGNLQGAAQGLIVLLPLSRTSAFAICGVVATALLAITRPRILLAVLLVCVVLMTGCFLVAALVSRPSPGDLLRGLTLQVPADLEGRTGFVHVAGLVGTTIVPYNLFLYSALTRDLRGGEAGWQQERRSLARFLPLGILCSIAVMVVAAAAFGGSGLPPPRELAAMARQLETPLGSLGRYVFAGGILAAGLSSALTAPLAAGLAVSELWPGHRPRLATTVRWMVMACGLASGLLAFSSTQIIQFAQITNGVLLPVSLGFLVWVTARSEVLGSRRTGRLATAAGIVVTGVTLLLAVRTIFLLGA